MENKYTQSNRIHQPLLRIVKTKEMSSSKMLLLRISALLMALVAGGIFVLILGKNPFSVYATIIQGSFKSKMAIQATIRIAVPLLITSLGLIFAFRMRFWNIGAEGQVIMGAVFASYFALFHSNLPHGILLVIMFCAGILGGGLWGLIPAYFKTKYNTNETLLTLMLNYIALYVIQFLREGPWRDPNSGGFPKIARFTANAHLDAVLGVHSGWIIALILLLIVGIYLSKTKGGYEISVVGESQKTAAYAGMNVKRIILRTMFLSGAICGIAGMIQATLADKTLSNGVAGGVGFTAIIVAWLAQLNPAMTLVVTVLFAILEKGSSVMQSVFHLSTYASDALQGIILFFVLGCEFFVRYRIVLQKGGDKA